MGIASTTLSLIPSPLRALARWAQSANRSPGHAADSTHPAPTLPAEPNHNGARRPASASPYQRPQQGAFGQRPLRGNWPFTVPSPPPVVERSEELSDGWVPSALPTHTPGGNAPRSITGTAHRTTKVLREGHACGGGRLVIAGRMADVCAELDRMAASEATLLPC